MHLGKLKKIILLAASRTDEFCKEKYNDCIKNLMFADKKLLLSNLLIYATIKISMQMKLNGFDIGQFLFRVYTRKDFAEVSKNLARGLKIFLSICQNNYVERLSNAAKKL